MLDKKIKKIVVRQTSIRHDMTRHGNFDKR